MEEEFSALTVSSTNEDTFLDLASIIKTKPDRATRDCFYNDLFSLSDIEALRKVIELLQVTLEDTNLAIESFEAWDYLTTRKLWEGLDDVFNDDALEKFGLPRARSRAKRKIKANWGLPAKESLNKEIRPLRHSSVILCLLANLSDVLSVEDANTMLKELIRNRKDIWQNASGQSVESPDNSETDSTDSETTDLEYFKDDINRSFTRGEHGSSTPFVLIWDLLDILNFAGLDSVLRGILGEIAEAVSFLSEGIYLRSCLRPEDLEDVAGSVEDDSSGFAIEFPCLCSHQTYDNLGFHDYPARNGWVLHPGSRRPLTKMDGARFSDFDAASFLQAWLFFGTIAEVFGSFGVAVQLDDFIRYDGEDPKISFLFLPSYLEAWVTSLDSKDYQSVLEGSQKAMEILSTVDKFTSQPLQLDIPDVLGPIVQLSAMLEDVYSALISDNMSGSQERESSTQSLPKKMHVLQDTLDRWFGDPPSANIPPDAIDGKHGNEEWYIVEYRKMQKAGWCPKDINKLVNDPVIAGLWYFYYASTLDRRVKGRCHDRCSKSTCLLQEVKEGQYMTQHYEGCMDCPHVNIDTDRVISILKEGRVARISVSLTNGADNTSSYSLAKLSVVDDGPYVAVSHVWSDGLGNEQNNSLPSCQLMRLKRQASELLGQKSRDGVTAIWIDTLCVPLEREGRKLALTQLGRAYEEADHVLVLDCELQQATMHCREEEQLMRILLSGWMQRLWTLEEAVLGRDRLYFRFLEGAVKLPSLIPAQAAAFWELLGQTPFLSHEIRAVAMDRFPHLSKFELPDTFISELLVAPFKPYEGPSPLYLLSGVQLRQTTKQEDQYLCSASLMRIDVRSIAQSDSTLDRARAFYSSLANRRIPIPAEILFSDEQKLPVDGFGWAPATLLSQSDNPLLLFDNITGWYFGPEGLFCRYPGYYLSDLPKDLSNYQCIVASYRQRAEIWEPVRPQFVDLTTFVNSSLVMGREENPFPGHFALLLNQINDANSEYYFGSSSSENLAVLAYIYRSEGTGVSQVIYARYIQAVRKIWPRQDDSDDKLGDMTSVLQSKKSYHAGASYLKHSNWCIG